MTFFIVTFVLALVVIFTAIILLGSAKSKATHESFASISDFNPSAVLTRAVADCGVAIDPQSRRFAVERVGTPRVFRYEQLIAVEIEKDGVSLQKTNRGSQAAGAIVGAALLGPAGMIVGGLTGSKRLEQKTSRLVLRLYVEDVIDPVIEVHFLNVSVGIAEQQARVLEREMNAWHGRFRAILHERDAQAQLAGV